MSAGFSPGQQNEQIFQRGNLSRGHQAFLAMLSSSYGLYGSGGIDSDSTIEHPWAATEGETEV